MAELKLGLAPGRTSYFDQLTNTYITLQAPVQSVMYNENDMGATVKRLEKIVHALFASVPALVLYEGKVPQESIDAWKIKYMKPFNTDMTKLTRDLNGNLVAPAVKPNRAFDRPEQVNDSSADNAVVTVSTGEAEEVKLDEVKPEEVKAEEVKAQELALDAEQVELLAKEEDAKAKKGSKAKSEK